MSTNSCITCPQPTGCNCKSSQTCVLIGRSCTSCGDYVCQDLPGQGGGGSSAGATAGQVVGGAAAGLIFAFLLYWFWWRKRRHASPRLPHSPMFNHTPTLSAAPTSLRRNGSHTGGNSSSAKVRFGDDAKLSAPAPRRSRIMSKLLAPDEKLVEVDRNLNQRSSHASDMSEKVSSDDPFDDTNSVARPNSLTSSLAEDANGRSVIEAMLNTGGSHDRIVSNTPSDFSFRSSHSTTNIPIAYIPAHANSMSVQDGLERGVFGETKSADAPPKRASKMHPNVNPSGTSSSTAKRLTALLPRMSGNDQQEVIGSALPSPTHSATSSAKAKPSRPDREGLDLRLPKIVQPAAVASFGVSSASPQSAHSDKRQSGFPWSAGHSPPATAATAGSRFSGSTINTLGRDMSASSLLPAPPLPGTANRSNARASDSTMSIMSHMSYILDPPQIVTANSAGRFEVVGHAQARAVQLPSSGPNAMPSTASAVEIARTGSVKRNGTSRDQVISNAISLDIDPFADEASAVASRFATTTSGDRTSYASSTPADVTIDMTQNTGFIASSHRPSHDSSQTEMSIFTSSSRPTTLMTTASRHVSTVSSNPHDSLLDAMPFVPPPTSSSAPLLKSSLAPAANGSPSSPHFPMPPRSPQQFSRDTYLEDPFADTRSDLATNGGNLSPRSDVFAQQQQQPANEAYAKNRQSEASVRTGYQSILEDVPFQIGFPNRNSAWSTASDLVQQNRASTSSMAGQSPQQHVFVADAANAPPVPTLTSEKLQQLNAHSALPVAQDAVIRADSDAGEERLHTPKMAQSATMEVNVPESANANANTAKRSSDIRDSLLHAALLSQQYIGD